MLKRLFPPLLLLTLLTLASLTLDGCATTGGAPEPAPITAGKSLLAVKQNIVMIRDGFGVPCQQGLVAPADCRQIDDWYQQSKLAYDSAVDAALVSLNSGTDSDAQAYAAKQAALVQLAADMARLAVKYGVQQGGAK